MKSTIKQQLSQRYNCFQCEKGKKKIGSSGKISQYNVWYYIPSKMRARLLQQLSPDHQLVIFFSSYLKDIMHIVTDVKTLLYQLIGIQQPPQKNIPISTDIHSVLFACNTAYQDMRRVETLLRGHVKGKIASEAQRQQTKDSRLTIHNSSNSRLRKDIDPYHLDQIKRKQKIVKQEWRSHYEQEQNVEEFQQKRIIESRNKQYEARMQSKEQAVNFLQKKIGSSKSQGQLLSRSGQTSSPDTPIYTANKTGNRSPLELINRIRAQLGLLGGQRQ